MPTPAKTSMRIKGRSFVALVLMPEPPIEDWLAQLRAQMARAPSFFEGRPVIVDVSACAGLESEFETLIATLEREDMRIIGVEGAAPGWTDSEVWGRPPIATAGRADRFVEIVEEEDEPEPPPPTSKLHRGPVRSGQTVLFEHGELTVLGPVASGAEVIAGGSIHIYGPLRGRAIAGFAGGGDASIFCTKLEAELVAINGVYKLAEDMPAEVRGKPAHVSLRGDSVVIATLG